MRQIQRHHETSYHADNLDSHGCSAMLTLTIDRVCAGLCFQHVSFEDLELAARVHSYWRALKATQHEKGSSARRMSPKRSASM